MPALGGNKTMPVTPPARLHPLERRERERTSQTDERPQGGTPRLVCTSTCNEAEIEQGENRADASFTGSQISQLNIREDFVQRNFIKPTILSRQHTKVRETSWTGSQQTAIRSN